MGKNQLLMDKQIQELQKKVKPLEERNKRVEKNKFREISRMRRTSIIITYLVAICVMLSLGDHRDYDLLFI